MTLNILMCDFVYQVTLLIFALMVASSVLMWLGMGEENPIDSLTVSRVWNCGLMFRFNVMYLT